MTTIVLAGGGTGGHFMPALAIAEGLRIARPECRVVLVGAQRGVEAGLLPSRNWPHHLLPAEPIYRRQWWKNLRWPVVAWRLVRAVDLLLDEERPAVVIGTGGYASGPVVWRAAGRGIRTAVLELDAVPGLATRLLARSAWHVYLAAPEARPLLRTGAGTEVFVTGAPILPPDPALHVSAHARFGLDRGKPVVLITGGSQGSLALNRAVARWVQSGGAGNVQLLWATGTATHSEFAALHRPPAVQVFTFLDPIAPALAAADLAVARAGSMTLAELCAWGVPAILVPLPAAAADHQTRNARVMAAAGAAVLLAQADLGPDRLATEVRRVLSEPGVRDRMAAASRLRGRPEATTEILGHIGRLAGLA